MPNPPPSQPSFEEAKEIATDTRLQQLLAWYPGQQDRILAAYRRRNPHPGCTCPWHTRKPGRCCIINRVSPPAHDARRRRTPSRAGQYREQLQK